ncbi:MAG: RraA family protein [Geminicoccaceae bacterium]
MSIDLKLLDQLRAFDTPTICNALEIVTPERRATGFTDRPFVCALPDLKPIVGFAHTATIRAREPAKQSKAEARELRLAYYAYMAEAPQPAITVIQDLDEEPGFGAFWGEVNTAIHQGLGSLGCITNGSIRDLDVIAPQFQLLAGRVGPSHAWVHVEAIRVEVEVHGMRVAPGDIIHADRHGAVVIPPQALFDLPAAIELLTRREAVILKAARAQGFDFEKLAAAMGEADEIH